jgi:hypothetical protein
MIRQDSTPPSDSASVNNCNFSRKVMASCFAAETKSKKPFRQNRSFFWQFHEKDEILTHEIDCFNLWMIV